MKKQKRFKDTKYKLLKEWKKQATKNQSKGRIGKSTEVGIDFRGSAKGTTARNMEFDGWCGGENKHGTIS